MPAQHPKTGRRFGDYRIIREIGRGGMGVVYEAEERTLRRRVALKVLPKHLSRDASFVNRFQREARAAARLAHPNLVEIHAVGEHGAVHFIAMEYVDGKTLQSIIEEEGALRIDRALRITLQLAEALCEANRHNIVHRDIKPLNIMISRGDRVKLMDFGLAKLLLASTKITSDNLVVGTPQYMSPEQCEGAALDCRSDVYSLGAVLFEMLAGHPPYQADSPLVMMRKIVEGPFPSLDDVQPTVPGPVAGILRRMTATAVQARYESPEALVQDLKYCLGLAPSPHSPWDPDAGPVTPTKNTVASSPASSSIAKTRVWDVSRNLARRGMVAIVLLLLIAWLFIRVGNNRIRDAASISGDRFDDMASGPVGEYATSEDAAFGTVDGTPLVVTPETMERPAVSQRSSPPDDAENPSSVPPVSPRRMLGYESGNALETPAGAFVSTKVYSGNTVNFPDGIGFLVVEMRRIQQRAHGGNYAGGLVAYAEESNGEASYTLITRTQRIEFWHMVGFDSDPGGQGNYLFSIDGEIELEGRIPETNIHQAHWQHVEFNDLPDERHKFEWRLSDRLQGTTSWWLWDDITLEP